MGGLFRYSPCYCSVEENQFTHYAWKYIIHRYSANNRMLPDGDKHPSIYLSHITINGIDETLAWSGPDKARQYVEDRVPGNIEWKTNLSDNVQAVVKDHEIIAVLNSVLRPRSIQTCDESRW